MLKEIKESPKLKELKALHPSANVIVIIFAIIMVWRGIWGLLDIYFFPGYPTFSHLTCLLIGAVVLYLDNFRIDNFKR